ncbi:MAG: fumarylacetoacetate hydrolase family protein [Verrucomicrobia bacterium]|nr:fumarylacetoacetate hydrolase family protein [Verrucomicrobiota bacterium]
MRLYSFVANDQSRLGVEVNGRLVDLNAAHAARLARADARLAPTMLDLIRGGVAALNDARAALAFASQEPARVRDATHEFDRIRLLAPISRPGKILCSGLNYRSHVEENPAATFLEDPRFFVKTTNTVIGPEEPIRWPGARFQVDYEVELAVVIGKAGRRLTRGQAMDFVFGYTILHDVTARWVQFKDKNEDMGKNFDTFCPMGPCLVTADEIPDPAALRLTLKLNGRIMQDRTNEDWCFPLPRLLEWFSLGLTFEPGDIVSTGTPAGIGYFRRPQVFLKPGDVCELEISGIGKLVNRVVADDDGLTERPPTKSAL